MKTIDDVPTETVLEISMLQTMSQNDKQNEQTSEGVSPNKTFVGGEGVLCIHV